MLSWTWFFMVKLRPRRAPAYHWKREVTGYNSWMGLMGVVAWYPFKFLCI